LDKEDYVVMFALDGSSGLQRAALGQPDLILLDVMMPGMDGFETCRQLEASEKTRDIPVIFMTALSDPVHKARGFECGAVDYIAKPFEREDMLARIKTHLRRQQEQDTLKTQNEK